MAISRLPPAPLTVTGRRLAKTIVTSPHGARVTVATYRRDYWSSRCGKAKYSDKSPYRYWASYPSLLRSRYQQLRNEAQAVAATQSTKFSQEEKSSGPKKEPIAKPSQPDDLHRSNVQAEELRYYEEFQRLTKEQWRAHVDLLKQAIERDPYVALFGIREQRGLWNPFRTKWLLREDESNEPEGESWNRPSKGPEQHPANKSSTVRSEQVSKDLSGAAVHNKVNHKPTPQETPSPTVTAAASNASSSIEEEVYIDPITLRKVTRPRVQESPYVKPETPAPAAAPAVVPNADVVSHIPVKTYKPLQPAATTSANSHKPTQRPVAGFASQPWLQREGFSESQDRTQAKPCIPRHHSTSPSQVPKVIHLGPQQIKTGGQPTGSVQSTRIESSLDRLADKANKLTTSKKLSEASSRRSLDYEAAENKTEDIDLLRASDIRAAAGKFKHSQASTSVHELALQRQALYAKFIERQREFERQLKKEVISALKHQSTTTKSPLWALWMLYDHEARKNWTKWTKEQKFSIKDHEEFEQMQFLTKAFITQMPSPSDIFKTGGTSLARFLDANRASMVIRDFKAFMDTWHMEMQTILTRRGARPFSEEVLEDIRKSLLRYNRELRQQILDGYGGVTKPPKKLDSDMEKLFDTKPTAEMTNYRDAMRRFEERSKLTSTDAFIANEKPQPKWNPPPPKRSSTDEKHLRQDKELYEAIKGVYEQNKDAFHPNLRSSRANHNTTHGISQDTNTRGTIVTEDSGPSKSGAETSRLPETNAGDILTNQPPASQPHYGNDALREDLHAPSYSATSVDTNNIVPQVVDTVVLKISHEDEDVKVHELTAAEVNSRSSRTKALNTSETEGFQKVLEFMRKANSRTLLPIMRLDSALNASGYLLANHTSDVLVYQKSVPAGPQPAVPSHDDRLAELLTQPWPNLTGAPEDVESLVNARTGRSIDTFKLRGSQTCDSSSKDSLKKKPMEATPQSSQSLFFSTSASVDESSAAGAKPYQVSPDRNGEPSSQQPFSIPSIGEHLPSEPSRPVRRAEPVFSGQSLRTHYRRRYRSHHHYGHFSRPRWVRRLIRAFGRAVYTVGLFLLGAYMIGLGIEWGRYRDDQRRAKEQEKQAVLRDGARTSSTT